VNGSGDAPKTTRLVLVGMMGAGKSSVGRAIAARLGWPYLDNDDLVREIAGRAAPEIEASQGADELHRLEVAALEEALRRPGPLVAGVAAFAVDDPASRELLRERATVAWLRARPETLRARIGGGKGRREDATSLAWLAEVDARRATSFADVADIVVDVDDLTVDQAVGQILAEGFPRPRR
jgi:shikimate kinase